MCKSANPSIDDLFNIAFCNWYIILHSHLFLVNALTLSRQDCGKKLPLTGIEPPSTQIKLPW